LGGEAAAASTAFIDRSLVVVVVVGSWKHSPKRADRPDPERSPAVRRVAQREYVTKLRSHIPPPMLLTWHTACLVRYHAEESGERGTGTPANISKYSRTTRNAVLPSVLPYVRRFTAALLPTHTHTHSKRQGGADSA
jgi:hypothetical protein